MAPVDPINAVVKLLRDDAEVAARVGTRVFSESVPQEEASSMPRQAIVVRSAGSAPGDEINPAVAEILTERGLDVSMEFPKPLTDEAARAADVIITMGCGDACPVYAGKRYLDWDLADPAGKPVDEVRPIVDEIDRRARALVAELLERSAAVD